ncbi:hypothetical protein FOTG_16614 [Fusarium oxysporum f. sp. vasinfectum 25433]|uniref:Secreted protein n=1 Tax=Fusarium oxysporum f. sp. vasinfectum 25433 TaxID=1089449 RepID=X0KN98_FUSOX|nr:hypothetical protein FOTG_16614 [Fusarium oxysporum f. sp. vasinfectum 25433]
MRLTRRSRTPMMTSSLLLCLWAASPMLAATRSEACLDLLVTSSTSSLVWLRTLPTSQAASLLVTCLPSPVLFLKYRARTMT